VLTLCPTVVSKRFSTWFLTGLILLLGIQLTGLSCLNEWQSVSPLSPPTLSDLHATGIGDPEERTDDGCPCHLAFVSVLSAAPEVACPVILIDLGNPTTWALGNPSLPFHPPLSL
jgi:hypothetical protein